MVYTNLHYIILRLQHMFFFVSENQMLLKVFECSWGCEVLLCILETDFRTPLSGYILASKRQKKLECGNQTRSAEMTAH